MRIRYGVNGVSMSAVRKGLRLRAGSEFVVRLVAIVDLYTLVPVVRGRKYLSILIDIGKMRYIKEIWYRIKKLV